MTAKKESVRGDKVAIHFEAGKCVHSRNCVLSRPDVFVPNVQGEWIHPERATPDEVATLAANCPSGAITYERFDGIANETAPIVNTVHVRENGPLAFHGALTIAGTDATFRATLCRCGASSQKPYCDGSHTAAGFAATGEPPAVESEPLPVRNGSGSIAPQVNGPLKVLGSLEVVSGTGHTINRSTLTVLCRCGASGNKPYCDGSHKRIGFVAP
jgi:CDGSH-type Zn-finger protein/uncharacterized Fe-S cluster protein YjdI